MEEFERANRSVCYSAALVCRLDPLAPGGSPLDRKGTRRLRALKALSPHRSWRAAQAIARRLLNEATASAAMLRKAWARPRLTFNPVWAELQVTIAEGGLANAASLAAGCGDLWVGVAPPKVVCIPYAFGGARSLVDDVRRMRETDVLLSTHGEALLHGFFLHAGAAVVEVRSHKFRDLGAWSDIYADAFADDGSVHHYTLLLDDRAALGYEERESDGAHLTAWDIWELPLVCPAAALARALRRIIAANASAPRESHRKLSIGGKVSAETQLFANTRPLPTVSYSAAGRTTWLEEHASLDANAEFGRRKLRALKALGPLPTVVSDERVSWTLTLTDLVLRRAIAGDIIETGTFRGGTTIAILFALADRAPEKAVWAADSFQGLPVSVAQDQKCDRRNNGGKACDIRSAGTFMSTRGTFESNLWRFAVNRTRLRVVEGWFSQTLPTSGMRRRGLSFIRADGDLYMSTRDALRALYPLLRPGGVIYIDDYGSFGGCGKAVDEFRDEHNISSPLHEIWEDNHSFFEAVWWTKAPSEYTEPSLLA